MAVFSNVDILERHNNGLDIPDLDKELLSSDAYDIYAGDIYEIMNLDQANAILGIQHGLSTRGLETNVTLPRTDWHNTRIVKGRQLEKGNVYVTRTETPIIIEDDKIAVRTIPKSGMARNGVLLSTHLVQIH